MRVVYLIKFMLVKGNFSEAALIPLTVSGNHALLLGEKHEYFSVVKKILSRMGG